MKLIIAIISDDDSKKTMRDLVKEGLRVTKLASTGGFLHAGNTTLLIGVDEKDLKKALSIIKDDAGTRVVPVPSVGLNEAIPMPIEMTIGGATLFVMDIDQYEKY